MHAWHIKQFKRAIRGGGIVAYPTESVYGLGCDPYDGFAVNKLLLLKQRPIHKGLILIASELSQLLPFLAPLNNSSRKQLDQYWPGPITLVMSPNKATPQWITGHHDKIAVRITAHPIAKTLCDSVGHPLVSTSANPVGLPPARSGLQIRKYFKNDLDLIVTERRNSKQSPTEIRDFETGKVIRPALN